MKHTLKITLFLVILFFIAQLIGLLILSKNVVVMESTSGVINIKHFDTIVGPSLQQPPKFTFWYFIIAFLIGTGIILILVKLKKIKWWKVLFFLTLWMTMSITFSVFMSDILALILSMFLTFWRMLKPNTIIRNLSELFIYAGIAIIFVPVLDIFWTITLLLVISTYDIFAVRKSKHMVKMMEFMTKDSNNAFAGMAIPYKKENPNEKKHVAVLGGGDIAFPLLFVGVVMEHLILVDMFSKITAFFLSSIIILIVTLSLFFLLLYSEKDKFYPAMPYLTCGCLAGYSIVWGLARMLLLVN